MENPLRILHVVVNMNRGGAETLIMNLYRNIDRSKIQFDFLTCKEGVFDNEIMEMGGKVHRIPYVTDVGHFGYVKKLNDFFSLHGEYKIIHSHMDKMSGIVLRAAKKANIPVRIAHSHATRSEGGMISRVYKWYAGRFIISAATGLVACSKDAAKWLFSGNLDKTVILRNGIENEKFIYSPMIREQVREELTINQSSFVVGHVGRFNRVKNHKFLIKIFAELVKIRPDSVLLLAGDGPLRSNMEQEVRKLNLESKVRFLGVRCDINRLLQAFDVFAFPSLFEGVPIVLIEAQTADLTCLVSNKISSEVDMSLGLTRFVPINDPVAWAEELAQLPVRKKEDTCTKLIDKSLYNIERISSDLEQYYINGWR
jgi:glycosyltransferase involved in cell wall biosynthesis